MRYTRVEPDGIVFGGEAGGWNAIWAGCVPVLIRITSIARERSQAVSTAPSVQFDDQAQRRQVEARGRRGEQIPYS